MSGPIASHAAQLIFALRSARDDLTAARVSHARLFIGPYEVRAPAYASLYLDPARRLMGHTSQQAASFYAEAGLSPGDGPRDAPDHLLYELEFMYFLRFQELETGQSTWPEIRRRFWSQHLSRWLPRMVALIRADGDAHPIHAALAELTDDLIAVEAAQN